ncbi:MAG: hypothetical protein ABIL09_26255 [Gemmatimonadota bacterium]
MTIRYLSLLAALAGLATAAAGDTRGALEQLQRDDLWGEARLQGGAVRPVRVLSLGTDSVRVCEVIGALQERAATYGLDQIETLRPLGAHRLAPNPAPFAGRRSTPVALGLELLVPGGGYFYTGDSRQAWSLLAFSSAAAATGYLTGKDGAAGWVPFLVWTKFASLTQLYDQVSALNAAGRDLARVDGRGPAPRAPTLVSFRLAF